MGHERDLTSTSPYAAPARAADLSDLPPAYVLTCGLDPLRDEGLDYAMRLARSDGRGRGSPLPGAWHLFEAFTPDGSLARETTAHWLGALRRAVASGIGGPPADTGPR